VSARRSSARRQPSPSKKQVRSRGLLVVTLLLVGAFAAGLAYIKQNAPKQTDALQPVSAEKSTADPTPAAPAQSVQSVLQIKPKYDFYNDLPKRQVVIGQDEIPPREQRQLQPPPEQTNTKPEQTTADRSSASSATASAKPAAKPVEMPKIELISRQGRSASTTPKAATPKPPAPAPANTTTAGGSGSWTIQAGAYSNFDEAERVRAKLAMMGIQARIEGGLSNNKQIHRVRIGPLLSRDVAVGINRRLNDNNIPALLIKSN